VDQFFVEAGGMRRYMDKIFDEIEELLRPQDSGAATPTDEPVIEVDESSPEALDPTQLDEVTMGKLVAQRFPRDEPGTCRRLRCSSSNWPRWTSPQSAS
jgi:hypothetical protein